MNPNKNMTDPLDPAPLTRQHQFVILVCALGSFCDVIEISVGNVLSAVFSVDTSTVAPGQLSWLLAAPYLGAVIATPLFGLLADRAGRRLTLIATLSILAVSSVASALSPGIRSLICCRVASGFATGSYAAIMATYLAEVMPIRWRGRMLLIACALGAIGWPTALLGTQLFSSFAVVGANAWRFICAGGGLGAAVTVLLAIRMSESPRWLRSRGQIAQADAALKTFLSATPLRENPSRAAAAPSAPNGSLPAQSAGAAENREHRPTLRAALFGVLFFLNPWSAAGFPLLSGAILIARGFALKDTLLLTGISALGAPVGLLVGSALVDRLERRTALMILVLTMAGAILLFATLGSEIALLGIAILLTLCLVNYIQVLTVYVAEIYATRSRAFAISAGWTVNRVASVIMPLVLLPLMHKRGAFLTCTVMAGTLLTSAVLFALGPRGRAGKPIL
jgi:MFS transporter, putative metabolite:H+ symporter